LIEPDNPLSKSVLAKKLRRARMIEQEQTEITEELRLR